MKLNSWLILRLGSMLFAFASGFSISAELESAKKLDVTFALFAGVFCYAGIKFISWIYQKKSANSNEIVKPSWLLPIVGSAQVLDFGGWFLVVMGISSSISMRKSLAGMSPSYFFIILGGVILLLTWTNYLFHRRGTRLNK